MIEDFLQHLYDNCGAYVCIGFSIWLSLKQGIKLIVNTCILPITKRHIKFLDDVTKTMSEFNKTLTSIILEQEKLRNKMENIDNKVSDLQTDLKEISREQLRQFTPDFDKSRKKS